MAGKSRIFFPLRTSVELFKDPDSPEAITRAKQAAVLYDEIIFESGLYDVSITPKGSTGWTTPSEQLTPELLRGSRRISEPGSRVTFSIRPEGSDTMMPVFDAPLSATYSAEFHTGIIDDLKEFKPDWVKVIELPDKLPVSQSSGKAVQNPNRHDQFDKELMVELREKTFSSASTFSSRSIEILLWQQA